MARTTIDEARSCKTWTYLTPSEFGALNAFAKTLDVSVSAVIRALVRRAIDDFPEGIGTVAGVPSRTTVSVPLSEPARDPDAPAQESSEQYWQRIYPQGGPPEDVGWAGSGFSGVPMPPWSS